jgi:hypothetical protein
MDLSFDRRSAHPIEHRSGGKGRLEAQSGLPSRNRVDEVEPALSTSILH